MENLVESLREKTSLAQEQAEALEMDKAREASRAAKEEQENRRNRITAWASHIAQEATGQIELQLSSSAENGESSREITWNVRRSNSRQVTEQEQEEIDKYKELSLLLADHFEAQGLGASLVEREDRVPDGRDPDDGYEYTKPVAINVGLRLEW